MGSVTADPVRSHIGRAVGEDEVKEAERSPALILQAPHQSPSCSLSPAALTLSSNLYPTSSCISGLLRLTHSQGCPMTWPITVAQGSLPSSQQVESSTWPMQPFSPQFSTICQVHVPPPCWQTPQLLPASAPSQDHHCQIKSGKQTRLASAQS